MLKLRGSSYFIRALIAVGHRSGCRGGHESTQSWAVRPPPQVRRDSLSKWRAGVDVKGGLEPLSTSPASRTPTPNKWRGGTEVRGVVQTLLTFKRRGWKAVALSLRRALSEERCRVEVEPRLEEVCSQVYPGSAICVQEFDDSRNSAIRITYRSSRRSSSLPEPRNPSLRVVLSFVCFFSSPPPRRGR
jgi:hypothetical protein